MKAIIKNTQSDFELSFIEFIGVSELIMGAIDKQYGGLDKIPDCDVERISIVISKSKPDGRIDVDIGLRSF